MRWTLLLPLLIVPFVGCRAEVPVAPGPESSGPDAVSVAEVPQSRELQGAEIEEIEADGWLIRRKTRPAGEATSGATTVDRARMARGGGAPPSGGGHGGAFRGPAGSAPPSVREPSDAAPPAPGAPAPTPTSPVPSEGGPALDAGDAEDIAADEEMPEAKKVASLTKDERGRVEELGRVGARPAGGAVAPARIAPTNVNPLKAGTTDDNDKYEDFLKFLATWSDQEGVANRYKDVDVRDRRWIRVVDKAGRPVPSARVQVIYEEGDDVLWTGTTYGDGRIPYYPHATSVGVDSTEPPAYLVQAFHGEARAETRWVEAMGGDLTLTLDVETALPEEIPLDVCFLIDTTGSMGDEIARIKATLLSVTEKLKGIEREFSLRYGAVLYRDLTDAYVTKAHPFTNDIEAFAKALQGVQAQGGGDTPESLNQGLAEAVGRMDWRMGAAKVMFLIADAPAHMDYKGDVTYDVSMKAAVDRGIRIHSVAASGLDTFGSLMFRQIAQMTRGKFIFIEYGGNVAASGASHGVAGAKKSNNLDDILFEQIEDELATWGRDPGAGLETVTAGR